MCSPFSPDKMTDVDLSFMVQHLNVDDYIRPAKQKKQENILNKKN